MIMFWSCVSFIDLNIIDRSFFLDKKRTKKSWRANSLSAVVADPLICSDGQNSTEKFDELYTRAEQIFATQQTPLFPPSNSRPFFTSPMERLCALPVVLLPFHSSTKLRACFSLFISIKPDSSRIFPRLLSGYELLQVLQIN